MQVPEADPQEPVVAPDEFVPGATPVICGFAAGIRSPSGMNTLGVTVATLVSLLTNEIVTPPEGASMPRLTANPEA